MKIFFPDDPNVMGFEATPEGKNKQDGNFFMIYDLSKNASIVLMETDGQKSRMAYGIDLMSLAESVDESEEDVDLGAYSVTKTGKTKTIMGHTCEEYLLDTDEGNAHYWISTEKIGANQTFFGSGNPFLQARVQNSQSTFQNLPQGNLFEMEYVSKTDKSSMTMTTITIENNKSTTFKMADYPSIFESMKAEN